MTTKPASKNRKTTKTLHPVKSYKQPVTTTQKKKEQKSTPGYLKFVYGFMLLLMLFSGVGRISGRNSRTPGVKATPQVQAASSGTIAKALTYHRENSASNLCDDLIITVGGDAVLSDCTGVSEQQYHLSVNERQTLSGWLTKYNSFDYSISDQSQIQFNGHSNQTITGNDLSSLITFVSTIDTEITTQP